MAMEEWMTMKMKTQMRWMNAPQADGGYECIVVVYRAMMMIVLWWN